MFSIPLKLLGLKNGPKTPATVTDFEGRFTEYQLNNVSPGLFMEVIHVAYCEPIHLYISYVCSDSLRLVRRRNWQI